METLYNTSPRPRLLRAGCSADLYNTLYSPHQDFSPPRKQNVNEVCTFLLRSNLCYLLYETQIVCNCSLYAVHQKLATLIAIIDVRSSIRYLFCDILMRNLNHLKVVHPSRMVKEVSWLKMLLIIGLHMIAMFKVKASRCSLSFIYYNTKDLKIWEYTFFLFW